MRQNAYGRRERNDHRQYRYKDETKSNAASAATAMRWGMARVSNRGMARFNKRMARQINIKSPLPLPDKAATAKTTTWHGATIKEGPEGPCNAYMGIVPHRLSHTLLLLQLLQGTPSKRYMRSHKNNARLYNPEGIRMFRDFTPTTMRKSINRMQCVQAQSSMNRKLAALIWNE